MKLSKFSIFIGASYSGQHTLYNTLTGIAISVDGSTREKIISARFAEIASEVQIVLVESGILVDSGTDENVLYRIKRDRVKYSSSILRFVIIPTFECNLSCRYCYVAPLWHGRQTPGSMSQATLKRVTRFVINTVHASFPEQVNIDFTGGGEPLLARSVVIDILHALRAEADRKNIPLRATLVTNGTLIRDDLLRQLRGLDITFEVSLDGPRYIHDAERSERNGAGTYNRVIEGLKMLTRYGFRSVVRVNVSRQSISGILELFCQLQSEFGENLPVRIEPILASSDKHSSYASDCLQRNELDSISELWQFAMDMGLFPILTPPINLLPCHAAGDACYVIDPRADVYKCEALAGQQEFKVASIGENGSLSNLRYAYYQWMSMDSLDNPECRECALLPACGGDCPAAAQFRTGCYIETTCMKSKKAVTESIRIQLSRFGLI